MSSMKAGLFLGQLCQTAYVTTDIDRAIELFGERYGALSFMRIEAITLPLLDGREMTLDIALAWVGDMQIEIIKPLAGDVDLYRTLLPRDGFAVRFHHLGIRLRSAEQWDEMDADVRARGHDVVLDIAEPGYRARYIDTFDELGHYMEYLYFEDAPRSILATIPQNVTGHVLDL